MGSPAERRGGGRRCHGSSGSGLLRASTGLVVPGAGGRRASRLTPRRGVDLLLPRRGRRAACFAAGVGAEMIFFFFFLPRPGGRPAESRSRGRRKELGSSSSSLRARVSMGVWKRAPSGRRAAPIFFGLVMVSEHGGPPPVAWWGTFKGSRRVCVVSGRRNRCQW